MTHEGVHPGIQLFVVLEQWVQDHVRRWAEMAAEQARTTLAEVLAQTDRIQGVLRAKGGDLIALTAQVRSEVGEEAMQPTE